MNKPSPKALELERRRRHAVNLLHQGEAPTVVARILGVHRVTLYHWLRQEQQPGGLAAKPASGQAPRLTDAQLLQLEQLLLQGAKAHGWPNELWTCRRIAQLIQRRFGISYHPDHVGRFLHTRLRWSCQKPERRARERDDDEIERWRRDEFPRILREAQQRGAHLAFLDESGFFLLAAVRRTWGPQGQTPILPAFDRRDRISAISAITVSPLRQRLGLYFQLLPKNINATAVETVDFLRHLKATLGGPLTVVWDRHSIHRKAGMVRAYLAQHPEIVAEDFPGYAPELNPDEQVWNWTKNSRLANRPADDADWLSDQLVEVLTELQQRPDLLAAFIDHSGLQLKQNEDSHQAMAA
jgi:transposase